MNKNTLSLSVVLGSLLVVGCKPGDGAPASAATQPTTAAEAASATPAAPAVRGGSQKGLIKADREMLADCGSTKVTVSWDISPLTPAINDVEIYTNGSLFAAGGSIGSQITGSWVAPGTSFVLKSKVDGAELDNLVIGGPDCSAQK